MVNQHPETKGIPVVTIGQDVFPGFYSSNSGFPSPLRLDTPAEVAALLHIKWSMGLEGSLLIANPAAAGQEIVNQVMEAHIRQALAAAAQQQIKGKEVTPFLLKYIAADTAGESLQTNIALVVIHARVGVAITVAYAAGSSKRL